MSQLTSSPLSAFGARDTFARSATFDALQLDPAIPATALPVLAWIARFGELRDVLPDPSVLRMWFETALPLKTTVGGSWPAAAPHRYVTVTPGDGEVHLSAPGLDRTVAATRVHGIVLFNSDGYALNCASDGSAFIWETGRPLQLPLIISTLRTSDAVRALVESAGFTDRWNSAVGHELVAIAGAALIRTSNG